MIAIRCFSLTVPSTDLLYKIPNSVPISARDWLNVDELIEVSAFPSRFD